eukprot:TRINITY_DN13282_c0_g1_i1.p2 TRINITY_DN13282_c0_g1~~TRINITY_DN13282_c0_g1_i1.p2  ORF type:complete len:153 (-),score=15.68 TRINITY_DN13282_c0_g1_i1:41-499(-)
MSEIQQLSDSIFNISSSPAYFQPKNPCIFCPKLFNYIGTSNMITRALYIKYSASQNFYYSKEMNKFLNPTGIKSVKIHQVVIRFFDNVAMEDYNEYVQKYQQKYENQNYIQEKLKYLGDYYKFHNDIPRIFLSLIHISSPRDRQKSRMPSSA